MKKILLVISLVVMVALVGCTSDYEYDDEHDHSVEIEGSDLMTLAVQEVADLWEIDSEVLLSKIVTEFNLKGSYTIDSDLEVIRLEYKFSPAQIKDMAEEIKLQGLLNE